MNYVSDSLYPSCPNFALREHLEEPIKESPRQKLSIYFWAGYIWFTSLHFFHFCCLKLLKTATEGKVFWDNGSDFNSSFPIIYGPLRQAALWITQKKKRLSVFMQLSSSYELCLEHNNIRLLTLQRDWRCLSTAFSRQVRVVNDNSFNEESKYQSNCVFFQKSIEKPIFLFLSQTSHLCVTTDISWYCGEMYAFWIIPFC